MSFFSGYSFFVYVFLLLLPAMVLGYLERPLRGYRRLLTAFFIWAVYRKSPGELLYLLAYAALSVYLVRFYLFFRARYGRNRYLYGHAVFIALAPLLVCFRDPRLRLAAPVVFRCQIEQFKRRHVPNREAVKDNPPHIIDIVIDAATV